MLAVDGCHLFIASLELCVKDLEEFEMFEEMVNEK
jgi:hypothetical protein